MEYRIIIFLFTFILFFVLENLFKRKTPLYYGKKKWLRFFSNLSLVFMGNLINRLLLPFLPIVLALELKDMNFAPSLIQRLELGEISSLILGVLLLDLAIYFQHVVTHKIPLLWRLHKVHHADKELDSTSALRFHPLEIYFSTIFKLFLIWLLGVEAKAVLIFEVLLSSSAIFNHANLRIPKKLDAFLRLIIVTPDMHRSHHSILSKQMNMNYGFCFPWWDRLFRTYEYLNFEDHDSLVLGTKKENPEDSLHIKSLLLMPFKRQ